MFPSGGTGGTKRSYEYYENQIKPRLVHVKGNHDDDNIPTRVTEVIIRFDRERVLCIHDPAKVKITSETPRYIITGHIHDKNRLQRVSKYNVVNVGVDVWNFQPIQFKDVMRVIKNYDNFFSGKDEHGKKLTYMPVINERWIKKADNYKTTGMWVADSETATLRGQ